MNLDPELSRYLRRAWQHNQETYREPKQGEPFRTPLFEFVRAVKAHAELGEMEAFAAADTIEPYFANWLGDRDFEVWSSVFPWSDDPRSEFIDTWQKIKWPHAYVERAVEAVKICPLFPKQAFSKTYAEFVSIAGHLQRSVAGPILLPCRKIAGVLGCKPTSVSRYRNLAIMAGLLRLQRRGTRAHREADEFIFETGKFNWTTGEEIDSENLKICVTREGACYTDTQDIQDLERKEESKETQESKDLSRETRKKRAHFSFSETHKCAINSGPHIPTSAELEESLEKTKHLRGMF